MYVVSTFGCHVDLARGRRKLFFFLVYYSTVPVLYFERFNNFHVEVFQD